MKFALILLAASCAFTQELSLPNPTLMQPIVTMPEEPKGDPFKKGTIYFRAMTETQPTFQNALIPGLGIGYRRSFGPSGLDLSFNYSQGKGWNKDKEQIVWTTPRLSYLHYMNPSNSHSLYGGIGLGWGGVYTRKTERADDFVSKEKSNFVGLIPNIIFGYEALRTSILTSFSELIVSQPLIPSTASGEMPGPIVELSVGAGF